MKTLLVVDLQREFRDKDGKYEEILKFIEENRDKYDNIIATRCINKKDSNFFRYECWFDCVDSVEPLDFEYDDVIDKFGYGLEYYDVLNPYDEYDLIGYNTSACVYKIALDLFDRGYKFRVLGNYCYSSDGLSDHEDGIRILGRNIGKALVMD